MDHGTMVKLAKRAANKFYHVYFAEKEDLVQEALMFGYRYLDKAEGTDDEKRAFIYTVMYRRIANYIRFLSKFKKEYAWEDVNFAMDNELYVDEQHEKDIFNSKHFKALTDVQKKSLIYTYVYGMSHEEIDNIFNIRSGDGAYRAIQQLRKRMRNEIT